MDREAASTSPMDEVVSSPRGQKRARCDSTEDRDDDGAGASIDAVKVEEEEGFAEKAGSCGFRNEALLQMMEMDAPHHADDLEQPEDTTRLLTRWSCPTTTSSMPPGLTKRSTRRCVWAWFHTATRTTTARRPSKTG
jgi:hypothetical protein